GIFMLFGLLQFWLAQGIFGQIGKEPKNKDNDIIDTLTSDEKEVEEGRNPFTGGQKVLIAIASLLGLLWIFNDPISKISEGKYNVFPFEISGISGSTIAILLAFVIFIILLVIRIPNYTPVLRDRMLAVMFFAFV